MLTDCVFSGFANLQLSGAKEGLRLMRRCKLGWAQDGCAEERSEARRTFMIGCKTSQPFFVKLQTARRRCQWHCFTQWTDAAMRCLLPQVQQQAAVAGTAKLAENGRSGPIPSASGPTHPVFFDCAVHCATVRCGYAAPWEGCRYDMAQVQRCLKAISQ